MNGAEKIVNAMKKVNKSNEPITSELVSVTVISKYPLVFQLENRMQLDSNFYELSNLDDWSQLAVGDTCKAQSFNNGQKYFILNRNPNNIQNNPAIIREDLTVTTNRVGVVEVKLGDLSQLETTSHTSLVSAINEVNGKGAPIGIVHEFAGASAPENYMICDGRAISRSNYSELFSIIGIMYGEGDGVTTFNIPNIKGRVIAGYDSNNENFNTIGKTGGEETHTLTVDEMPSHRHNTGSNGITYSGTYMGPASAGFTTQKRFYTDEIGGDQPHNILQPYITMNYIIKVK